MSSIHLLITIAYHNKWKVYKADCALVYFMENPKYDYKIVVIQVIKYFKRTKEKGLQY
jgi:hypothetical protein